MTWKVRYLARKHVGCTRNVYGFQNVKQSVRTKSLLHVRILFVSYTKEVDPTILEVSHEKHVGGKWYVNNPSVMITDL